MVTFSGIPEGHEGIHQTNHSVAFSGNALHQTQRLTTTKMGAKINIMLHFNQIQIPVIRSASSKPRRSMVFLEPVEVLSVLRAAKAKGSREWALILLAYKHGLRVSEVCNLRLGDIDMKNGS